jgi:hypothetical protein
MVLGWCQETIFILPLRTNEKDDAKDDAVDMSRRPRWRSNVMGCLTFRGENDDGIKPLMMTLGLQKLTKDT